MNLTATVLTAALLLAACLPQTERGIQEISASEREAEEAATAYQTIQETFTAPAENDNSSPTEKIPSDESASQ
ncbi:MAG: hypothetical protein Q4A49_03755 [Neisseria sp.]|nr:hypothetical protein [Neisseria sp.]